MPQHRFRIRYAKSGDLRLIGHRDLVRAFERLFRRVGLELAMSQGFHPRPLLTFPDALALGIEGQDEVMDVVIEDSVEPDVWHQRLSQQAPAGLTIRSVVSLLPTDSKARIASVDYAFPLPKASIHEELHAAIAALRHQSRLATHRRGKPIDIDLQATLRDLRLDGDRLVMSIVATSQSQLQPRDILAALGLQQFIDEGVTLIRTKVELAT